MYYAFTETFKHWREWSFAPRTPIGNWYSEGKAIKACKKFNDNRTAEQVDAGTEASYIKE